MLKMLNDSKGVLHEESERPLRAVRVAAYANSADLGRGL